MRARFPLHNSVIPGKVYSIRDRAWNNIGEITASNAAEALRRGFRFSERFLMKLSRETVERLCREIIRYADEHMHSGPVGNTPDMRSLAANKLPR